MKCQKSIMVVMLIIGCLMNCWAADKYIERKKDVLAAVNAIEKQKPNFATKEAVLHDQSTEGVHIVVYLEKNIPKLYFCEIYRERGMSFVSYYFIDTNTIFVKNVRNNYYKAIYEGEVDIAETTTTTYLIVNQKASKIDRDFRVIKDDRLGESNDKFLMLKEFEEGLKNPANEYKR